jgi:hypothetical protein
VPGRGHAPDRPGGLSHAPRQGDDRVLLGVKGGDRRVRARPLAPALALGALREGAAGRARRRGPGRLRGRTEGARPARQGPRPTGEGPRPPRPVRHHARHRHG